MWTEPASLGHIIGNLLLGYLKTKFQFNNAALLQLIRDIIFLFFKFLAILVAFSIFYLCQTWSEIQKAGLLISLFSDIYAISMPYFGKL